MEFIKGECAFQSFFSKTWISYTRFKLNRGLLVGGGLVAFAAFLLLRKVIVYRQMHINIFAIMLNVEHQPQRHL